MKSIAKINRPCFPGYASYSLLCYFHHWNNLLNQMFKIIFLKTLSYGAMCSSATISFIITN